MAGRTGWNEGWAKVEIEVTTRPSDSKVANGLPEEGAE